MCTHKLPRRGRTYLVPLLAFSSVSLAAQEAPPANADDEVVYLPAFEVTASEDRGYYSANSVSATSLNMAIRDLPVPVEVVNEDLITDIGATNIEEALRYSAGIQQETFQSGAGSEGNSPGANNSTISDRSPSSSASTNDPFANTVNIRGYDVPNQQRLGFRVGSIVPAYGVVLGSLSDSVNIQRLEIVRGPASLLYGINVLSGIVNQLPKRPMSEYRGEVTYTTGSYDLSRSTLDVTGPLIRGERGLNFRLAGSYETRDDWTDFRSDEKRYAVAQLEWYPFKRSKLFTEVQYGNFRREGIGAQSLYDSFPLAGSWSEFRNEYNERYNWAWTFDNQDEQGTHIPKPGATPEYGHLDRSFRLSGPDTYYERDEWSFVSIFDIEPVENLTIRASFNYSHQDVERFEVALKSITRGEPELTPQSKNWAMNPELEAIPATGATSADGGVAELFRVPNPREVGTTGQLQDDWKFVRYFWYENPSEAETWQYALKASYLLETEWLGGERHTFTIGRQEISDTVSFIDTPGGAGSSLAGSAAYSKYDEENDPYQIRGIFDFSPLRYQGENVAILGDNRYNPTQLGYTDEATGKRVAPRSFVRSGYMEADLWYLGHNAIYQGELLDGKLNLILGARNDRYQVKEREQLRIRDVNPRQDPFLLELRGGVQGRGQGDNQILPYTLGYGTEEFTPIPALDDIVINNSGGKTLNQLIAEEYAQYRRDNPNGTQEYNFVDENGRPESVSIDTATAALSYRLTEDLSLYLLTAEGVFPNSGLRDGLDQPIGAETTQSYEIGLKFDLWDGKISGTLSAFQIERENAVWYWSDAPNPSRWVGGANEPQSASGRFDPSLPISYEIDASYLDAAIEAAGFAASHPELFDGRVGAVSRDGTYVENSEYGIAFAEHQRVVTNAREVAVSRNFVNISYDALKDPNHPNPDFQQILVSAMEAAFNDRGQTEFVPIYYSGGTEDTVNNNPSNSQGANVLFAEKGTGIDGQIIFSPTENWQILFTFSHVKREVDGPLVLAPTLTADGTNYTTEYDAWVRIIGRENFETDENGRPLPNQMLSGGGIDGVSLYFGPTEVANIWTNYAFDEGPLDGLSAGLGVRYTGPAQTAVAIGGTDLAENLYMTPETKERYTMDFRIGYRWKTQRVGYFIQFNVYNLLDDDHSLNTITYYDGNGAAVAQRRTEVYHSPRTFRIRAGINF
ncbi:MAG: TonB-dependent receptor plug domain-containing protein [Verrucomicrobiota bacterium JB022]|nr:TonB-dependent receptor plug domain-containing protein [Verrucomicrobiota bacterium JB022]